jgi:hypothetical protein
MPKNSKNSSNSRKNISGGGYNFRDKLNIYANYLSDYSIHVLYYYNRIQVGEKKIPIKDLKKIEDNDIINISNEVIEREPNGHDYLLRDHFIKDTLSDENIAIYEEKIKEKEQIKEQIKEQEQKKEEEKKELNKLLENLVKITTVGKNDQIYGLKGNLYIEKNDNIENSSGYNFIITGGHSDTDKNVNKKDIKYIAAKKDDYEKLDKFIKLHFKKKIDIHNDSYRDTLYEINHDVFKNDNEEALGGKRKKTRKNKQQKKRRTHHRRR